MSESKRQYIAAFVIEGSTLGDIALDNVTLRMSLRNMLAEKGDCDLKSLAVALIQPVNGDVLYKYSVTNPEDHAAGRIYVYSTKRIPKREIYTTVHPGDWVRRNIYAEEIICYEEDGGIFVGDISRLMQFPRIAALFIWNLHEENMREQAGMLDEAVNEVRTLLDAKVASSMG